MSDIKGNLHYEIIFKKDDKKNWTFFTLSVSNVTSKNWDDWEDNDDEAKKFIITLKELLAKNKISLTGYKKGRIYKCFMSKESLRLISFLVFSSTYTPEEHDVNKQLAIIKEEKDKYEEYNIDDIFISKKHWNEFLERIKNFNINPIIIKNFKDFYDE